jgi:hypothetical protein
MKVASYTLQYGRFYPKSVHNYIHERVGALGRRLQRQLGDEYVVHTSTSKESEASYLRIRYKLTDTSYTVSFRNHGEIGTKHRADKVVKLSAFKTWKYCREIFITRMLPTILEELHTDKVQERGFEKSYRILLHEIMDIVLSEGGRV